MPFLSSRKLTAPTENLCHSPDSRDLQRAASTGSGGRAVDGEGAQGNRDFLSTEIANGSILFCCVSRQRSGMPAIVGLFYPYIRSLLTFWRFSAPHHKQSLRRLSRKKSVVSVSQVAEENFGLRSPAQRTIGHPPTHANTHKHTQTHTHTHTHTHTLTHTHTHTHHNMCM